MSVTYKPVQWNRHKRLCDLAAASLMALFIIAFVGVASVRHAGDRAISPPILLMRALGACALVNLHIILLIGPLARFTTRLAPLLYNRRHLGVMTFALALLHAVIALGFYGGFGAEPAPLAMFGGYGPGARLAFAPFEVLGLGALLILFLMAATSHDFFLANLSPGVWKWLHMGVYGAYGLLVLHVALGSMQSERSLITPLLLLAGIALVGGTHIAAGIRERRARPVTPDDQGWVDAGPVEAIGEGRCRVVHVAGMERIALVRHQGALAAMSNVCAHQGGPLGEGRVVGGCLTCPWHGYQYDPHSACAPAPFTEKLPLYAVRIADGRVRVNTQPREPGSSVAPCPVAPCPVAPVAPVAGAPDRGHAPPEPVPEPGAFYVGYLKAPEETRRTTRLVVGTLAAVMTGLGVLLALAQRDPGAGRWHDELRDFAGTLHVGPYPRLITDDGLAHFLVREGKFGPGEIDPRLDVERVVVRGTLLERGDLRLIELTGDVQLAPEAENQPSTSRPTSGPGTRVAARGEIVDAKCFAGAMKPGDGKAHKACAVLCIAGGVPPVFVAIDPAHPAHGAVVRMRGPDGAWVVAPQWIGQGVELEGRVFESDGMRWLEVSRASPSLAAAWGAGCAEEPRVAGVRTARAR